jgi:hypothetical protein
MYEEMRAQLKQYLIQNGFTYSNEREPMGEPTLTRSIPVDVLVDSAVEFLVGAGYANHTKTTV